MAPPPDLGNQHGLFTQNQYKGLYIVTLFLRIRIQCELCSQIDGVILNPELSTKISETNVVCLQKHQGQASTAHTLLHTRPQRLILSLIYYRLRCKEVNVCVAVETVHDCVRSVCFDRYMDVVIRVWRAKRTSRSDTRSCQNHRPTELSHCRWYDVPGNSDLIRCHVLVLTSRIIQSVVKLDNEFTGTQASAEMSKELLSSAVYIANQFFLTSDAYAPVVKDTDLTEASNSNLIILSIVRYATHTWYDGNCGNFIDVNFR